MGARPAPEKASKGTGQRSIKAFFAPAQPRSRLQQQSDLERVFEARQNPATNAEGSRNRLAAAAAAKGQAATAVVSVQQGLSAAVPCTASASGQAIHTQQTAVENEASVSLVAAAPAAEQHEQQAQLAADCGRVEQHASGIDRLGMLAPSTKQQATHAPLVPDQLDRQRAQQDRQQGTGPAARSAARAPLAAGIPSPSPTSLHAGGPPTDKHSRLSGMLGSGADGLTALELQRLERIRRNQEVRLRPHGPTQRTQHGHHPLSACTADCGSHPGVLRLWGLDALCAALHLGPCAFCLAAAGDAVHGACSSRNREEADGSSSEGGSGGRASPPSQAHGARGQCRAAAHAAIGTQQRCNSWG